MSTARTFRTSRPRSSGRICARHGLLCALLAAALLAVPVGGVAVARADEAATILERCAHLKTGATTPLAGFSQAAYAKALRMMSTVEREYSPCEELIRQAQLAAAGGRSGGMGGAGGLGGGEVVAPPTPAEQQTLARTPRERPRPVRLGRTPVRPGVVRASVASTISALPGSLIALLSLLVALGVGVGAPHVRRLVGDRWPGAGQGGTGPGGTGPGGAGPGEGQ